LKLTRREAVKTVAGAGVALAAISLLGGVTAAAAAPSSVSRGTSAGLQDVRSNAANDEPLIIIAKGDQILAFKGMEEVRVKDGGLTSTLHSTFQSRVERVSR